MCSWSTPCRGPAACNLRACPGVIRRRGRSHFWFSAFSVPCAPRFCLIWSVSLPRTVLKGFVVLPSTSPVLDPSVEPVLFAVIFPRLAPAPYGTSRQESGRLLQEHGIAAVPHAFRSSFRDWAAEKTDHPREVIEAALAHVVGNRVEAAYARSDLFERRRRLMNDWAAYLAGERRAEDSPAPRPSASISVSVVSPAVGGLSIRSVERLQALPEGLVESLQRRDHPGELVRPILSLRGVRIRPA